MIFCTFNIRYYLNVALDESKYPLNDYNLNVKCCDETVECFSIDFPVSFFLSSCMGVYKPSVTLLVKKGCTKTFDLICCHRGAECAGEALSLLRIRDCRSRET